jgi:hypothetical protein
MMTTRLLSAARTEWARRRGSRVEVGAALQDLPVIDETDTGELAVRCIIFSKDRAMQLDACVRSIQQFARYDGSIIVIYKATTPAFARGYELLDPGDRVRLVAESDDFGRDVMEAIDPEVPYTVFQVDDDVFFRRPPAVPVVPESFAALSLRLGENTSYCYPMGQEQAIPDMVSKGHLLAWNWMRASGDFSYPMSLDGHVFRTSRLVRMLSGQGFTNPSRLEEALTRRRFSAPPLMLSFPESCVVSLPVNIVTTTHSNRAGADPGLSAEALNSRFLAGERIDLEAMDFSAVRGAHQEIALKFTTAS